MSRWSVTTKWKDGQSQTNTHDTLDAAISEVLRHAPDKFVESLTLQPQDAND